ncbi:MAG: hypothetical protein KF768_02690 [Phycisphaeraceae bacterium]|nr:hypothetical protein [Phycisphaeraceae bacterium]
MPAESVLSVEPWMFEDAPGVLVTLPHHRLRTTRTDEFTLRTLPTLLDYAVERYRRPLGDHSDLRLPPVDPARPLEVYLLRERAQWRSLTRTLLGPQAGPYLRINRGGYAWGGRAVLMDLSPPSSPGTDGMTGELDPHRDTLIVAAHEGWHQYTQRSFRQPLPVWLEEGFATVMEGLIDQSSWRTRTTSLRPTSGGDDQSTPSGSSVRFPNRERGSHAASQSNGWPPANADRLHDLRGIVQSGRLQPLADLLSSSPSELLSTATDARPGLRSASAEIDRYYAQVWAMTLWLMTAERGQASGPSKRESLRTLLADAAGVSATRQASEGETSTAGGVNRVRLRVVEALGSDRVAAGGSGLLQGPAVFLAYFGHDLDAHDADYRAYVLRLIAEADEEASAPGSGDR